MNQGNINLNDPKIRQQFEQFCQMYNQGNQMNNPMMMNNMNMGMGQMNMGQMNMGQMPMGQMPMGQMPMGQMPMGQMNMGQIPMGQIPMGQMPMGQMPMGQMNMGGQMPMGNMNMQFNNMGQMPFGQMNNMNMNNMFMMYMNNPQGFNNQNFNINNSMYNLNSQISNLANINNINNPMSYSSGNVVPIMPKPSNNDDDKDKGVLPRVGNDDDDNNVLPPTADTINIKFDASTGVKKIIRANNNTTLKELLKMYMQKIGLPDTLIGKQVVFLFCGEKIDVESTKTLKEQNIRNMSSITVFDQGNVIGAHNIKIK